MEFTTISYRRKLSRRWLIMMNSLSGRRCIATCTEPRKLRFTKFNHNRKSLYLTSMFKELSNSTNHSLSPILLLYCHQAQRHLCSDWRVVGLRNKAKSRRELTILLRNSNRWLLLGMYSNTDWSMIILKSLRVQWLTSCHHYTPKSCTGSHNWTTLKVKLFTEHWASS